MIESFELGLYRVKKNTWIRQYPSYDSVRELATMNPLSIGDLFFLFETGKNPIECTRYKLIRCKDATPVYMDAFSLQVFERAKDKQ